MRHELATTAYAPSEAVCRVCGTTVGDVPVVCPECLTPHHRDCWEYNGGCATYACPAGHVKARPRAGGTGGGDGRSVPVAAAAQPGPPPDKLPFPVLQAGTFLGFFYVTWPAAVVTIVAEILGLQALGYDVGAAFMWFALMVAAIAWAAATAETYNIDIKGRRITRSKLVLGHEVLGWPVCSLDEVSALGLVRCEVEGRICRKLICRMSVPKLLTGTTFDLTPPYGPGSPDDFAMDGFIYRLESGSNVAVLVGPSAGARAGAGAAGELPPAAKSGDE